MSVVRTNAPESSVVVNENSISWLLPFVYVIEVEET